MKEPKQVVYEDRYFGSVARYSSNKNQDIHESENAGETTKILERNGWYH